MYKFFLCVRYLRKRHMVFFAIAAVTLCVAMVLIVVSVMGGFLDMVRDRSRGLLGDIVLDGPVQGFPYYDEFIAELKTGMPDAIHEATPVIILPGLLRLQDTRVAEDDPLRRDLTRYVQIVAIRMAETKRVTAFGESLHYEKYYPGTTTFEEQRWPIAGVDEHGNEVLPDELEAAYLNNGLSAEERDQLEPRDGRPARRPGPYLRHPLGVAGYIESLRPGIVLGVDLFAVRTRDGTHLRPYTRGHPVVLTVLPLSRTGGISGTGPTTILARVTDDSHTGVYEIDSLCVYADFELLQRYADMGVAKLKDLRLLALGNPAALAAELDRQVVPAAIRKELTLSGIFLSPEAVASGEPIGEGENSVRRWHIRDGPRHFRLELEKDEYDDETDVLALYEVRGTTPPRTSQIQIKLKPGVDSYVAIETIRKRWIAFGERYVGKQDWELLGLVDDYIKTWEEKQATFIAAVEKEKVLVTILFGVISVVAVFLVGCVFYMIVQEKTRDIGVLRAVGASAYGVASIFLAYGAAVGVVSSALGSLIGALFVLYINEFQDLLVKIHPNLQVWSPQVYSFDRIPNTVKTNDVIGIVVVAMAASVLGALWAARRASRIWPVEALRYE